jgi:hypothetical protein
MKRHRWMTPTVGLMMALCGAVPVAAPASPLLSGYGGPGQGNQAILGSALLNGSRGGGGGAAGGGGGGGLAASASAPVTGSAASAATRGRPERPPKRVSANRQANPAQGSPAAAAPAASLYPASERGAAAGHGGALGLSGSDVLYIILALGTLAFAAVLTRRLARGSAAGDRSGSTAA